eukprot:CAMPEP_0205809560 /NCGR_PEP_ID=MMETSP0205-20121125/13832_1 /ASSEMBLY_ACC=CAM_ASM_000278 /TAXON_ID=36767 /ORGANISM="Euplotes focardii, Strain TN1" /LENGTH=60 /DNA_ID=CAMNT_0053086997 /DNA_START=1110 /DNA_END=1289 /DNA_ORIENTATION=+
MTKEEIEEILKAVDTDKNGAINYNEFIAATLNIKLMTDKGKLKKLFDIIDINKDGTINSE